MLVLLEGGSFYGVCIERNYDTFVDGYEPAADLNVVFAVLRPESCYLKRIGMKREPRMALFWHEAFLEIGELLTNMLPPFVMPAVLAL